MSSMTPNKGKKDKKNPSDSKKNTSTPATSHAIHNVSEDDLSFDLPGMNFKKCLEDVKLSCKNQIDMLMEVIGKKDNIISALSEKVGKLTSEVEHLKKCYSFLSNETSEIKTVQSAEVDKTHKQLEYLDAKTQDLEDRSRRNNLVIFGVPEAANDLNEDCDKLICNLLQKHKVIDNEEAHPGLLERAHRLGKKKHEQEKPRPIIVCCGSFKDKQYILRNSNKLKGTQFSISEDFSKATLAIRRELVNKGKEAKNENPAIQGFQVKYKRLVIKYLNPTSNKIFTWSFGINDTRQNSKWFVPPPLRTAHPGNSRDGYQHSH